MAEPFIGAVLLGQHPFINPTPIAETTLPQRLKTTLAGLGLTTLGDLAQRHRLHPCHLWRGIGEKGAQAIEQVLAAAGYEAETEAERQARERDGLAEFLAELDEDPEVYRIPLVLAHGVKLEIIQDGHDHRHLYKHTLRKRGEGRDIALVVETSLVLDYQRGHLQEMFQLSQHLIRPQVKGPAAKVYLNYEYRRTGSVYRLDTAAKGCSPQRPLSEQPALVPSASDLMPIAVPQEIPIAHGRLAVPYPPDGEEDPGVFSVLVSLLDPVHAVTEPEVPRE